MVYRNSHMTKKDLLFKKMETEKLKYVGRKLDSIRLCREKAQKILQMRKFWYKK